MTRKNFSSKSWKKFSVPVILFMVLVQSALSTTIDELYHPLLQYKQFKLSPGFKVYSTEFFCVMVGQDSMNYLISNINCSPRFSYGLKENLQLSINGTYQFPMEFSHPQYYEWDYHKDKKTLHTLSGELVYRPQKNLQLSIFWFGGNYKEEAKYARNMYYNAFSLRRFNTHVLTFTGTWISRSIHSHKMIKPDLDGLHHPLLDKGQIKIQPEIQINWYNYSFYDSDDGSSDFFEENSGYKRIYISTDIAVGITDKFQVEGNFLYFSPFHINNYSEGQHTWGDRTAYSIERKRKGLTRNTGLNLELIHRFSPLFELVLEGVYYQYRVLTNVVSDRYINGEFQSHYSNEWRSFFKDWSLKLAGSWVSRPKKQGIPLTSDLAGLNHPLLEKKQVKIDGFIYYRNFNDGFDYNFIKLNTTANYGLFKAFQLSGSFGLNFYKHLYTWFKYEKSFTGKLAIKWRPNDNFEIYLTSNYNPFVIDPFPPSLHHYEQELTYIDLRNNSYGEKLNLNLGIDWLF